MPRSANHSKVRGGPGRTIRDRWNGLFHLVRNCHIFSSTVREILEVKYLSEVSPDDLSLSQFHLLKLISLNGDHHIGDVAEFLGVTPPAATKNIDKLERLGLLSRRASASDRRVTVLSASTKGRQLVRNYENLKSQRMAPVLKKFTQSEINQLASLLERFSLYLMHQEEIDNRMCLRCAAYWEEGCPVGQMRGSGCPYHSNRTSHQSAAKRKEQ